MKSPAVLMIGLAPCYLHLESLPKAANSNRSVCTQLAISVAEIVGKQLKSVAHWALDRQPLGS